MLLQNLLELCTRAHYGTSHSPEQRGKYYVESYSDLLAKDLAGLPEEKREAYKTKYIALFTAWMRAKCNCLSTMIAGPSNFPVRRAQRANRTEEARCAEFTKFRERYFSALAKAARAAKRAATDPIEELKKDIEHRETTQKIMKAANKIIKGGKATREEKILALLAIGISKDAAEKLFEKDFCGRIGFADYLLTNNLANIKRLKIRLTELEAKEVAKQEAATVETERKDGVKVVQNREADRLQIFFPGKPDTKTISSLKSKAFKWSPSNGCWQRQLTANAIYAANQILN